MAETPSKRLREESHEDSSHELDDSSESPKRQKPYNNILNLLDDEEEEEVEPRQEPSHELSHDLSAIFTTLQQELASASTSCDSTTTFDSDPLPSKAAAVEAELSHHQATSADYSGGDEDDGVKSVMRHLLEASDDELGIPNRNDEDNIEIWNSGENLPFAFTDHHGLWELEDEAANYYTVLQSGLFM